MAAEDLGPYRLEGLLGRGGMGEVYRAFDTTRKRVVALKVLSPQLAADPEYQARFRAESEMAARLRSAHVIPIHDYGEIDGVLFLDMRLVDGVDLATRLRERGPLPPADAAQVIGQTANALDSAHAAGLVHRDVKPSNILLSATDGDGPGFAYLVDFGIARAVDGTGGITGTGAVVGSVDYMAPERFEGLPIDHRADVYSLGCTLFEALTASKPFPGGTLAARLYSHLHAPPPRPSRARPSVPTAFDAVVEQSMAKDPRRRFASAGALATAARSAVTASIRVPAPPNRAGLLEPPARPGPRPPYQGPTRTEIRPPRYFDGPPPHGASAPGPVRNARRRWAAAVGALVLVGGTTAAVLAATADRELGPSGPGTAAPGPPVPGTAATAAPAQPGPPRVVRVVENLPFNSSSGVAIDPTGSRFYLTGPGEGQDRQVEAYQLDGNAPVGVAGLSNVAVRGLALAPDGNRLYVSTWVPPTGGVGEGASALAVVDPDGPTLTGTVPLAGVPGPVAVAPRGDRVYVGMPEGLEMIDPVAGRSLGAVALGGSVEGIAVTADGLVLTAGASGVKVVDPVAGAVTATIALRGSPAGIAVTPDGRRALVSTRGADAVAFLDLTTMTATGGVAVGSDPESVVITPDGGQALVANYGSGNLSVIDLGTGAVTELNVGSYPEAIAMSPDGLVGLVVTSANVVRLERVAS